MELQKLLEFQSLWPGLPCHYEGKFPGQKAGYVVFNSSVPWFKIFKYIHTGWAYSPLTQPMAPACGTMAPFSSHPSFNPDSHLAG